MVDYSAEVMQESQNHSAEYGYFERKKLYADDFALL